MSGKLIRLAYRSLWQNGVAERRVSRCRRELVDHVAAFNEAHLWSLVCEYLRYYHAGRTHDGLGKDRPEKRPVEGREARHGRVVAILSLPKIRSRHKNNQQYALPTSCSATSPSIPRPSAHDFMLEVAASGIGVQSSLGSS